MTEREWAMFTAEVEATFRGDLAEDREAALLEYFGPVEYEWGKAALRRLVMNGQVWMPTPAELIAALRAAVPGNGWDFRRVLAGRTEPEQRALDHLEVCRALNVAPDPAVVAQLEGRGLLDAAA